MKLKIIVSTIIIGLLLTTSIATVNAKTCERAVIYVDGNNTEGPWDGTIDYPYQYIQDGVDAAETGNTVFVFNGTYNEYVDIGKSIYLIGENRDSTIIKGTVKISNTNYVTICSFTFTKKLDDTHYFGITLRDSNYNIIRDNAIVDSSADGWVYAISLDNSCHNRVSGNSIKGNKAGNWFKGIYLYKSDDNIITGNTFKGNKAGKWLTAIELFFANRNTIKGNIIKGNGELFTKWSKGIKIEVGCNNTIAENIIEGNKGTGSGIEIKDPYNTVKENTIKNNKLTGITLKSNDINFPCQYNNIFKNEIAGNQYGIVLMWFTSQNNIFENNIYNNDIFGIYIQKDLDVTPNNNKFYYNNFEKNGGIFIDGNAKDQGFNTWDDNNGKGNYWDDYKGKDSDGNGIGDTPYSIPGGSNKDRYPLMRPYPDSYSYNNQVAKQCQPNSQQQGIPSGQTQVQSTLSSSPTNN